MGLYVTLSITGLCDYAEGHVLFIIMLNVITHYAGCHGTDSINLLFVAIVNMVYEVVLRKPNPGWVFEILFTSFLQSLLGWGTFSQKMDFLKLDFCCLRYPQLKNYYNNKFYENSKHAIALLLNIFPRNAQSSSYYDNLSQVFSYYTSLLSLNKSIDEKKFYNVSKQANFARHVLTEMSQKINRKSVNLIVLSLSNNGSSVYQVDKLFKKLICFVAHRKAK